MQLEKRKKERKKENWACAFFCLLAGFLSFGVMGHCWCIMHLMHIMHIILGNGINSVNVVNVVNAIIFDTSRHTVFPVMCELDRCSHGTESEWSDCRYSRCVPDGATLILNWNFYYNYTLYTSIYFNPNPPIINPSFTFFQPNHIIHFIISISIISNY